MPTLSVEEIRGLSNSFIFYARLPKTLWADIGIAEKDTEEGQAKRRELLSLYQSEYLSKP